MQRIYLASKSPRRIAILKRLGFPFEVIERQPFDESFDGAKLPETVARTLAQKKAVNAIIEGDKWTLAADTVVAFDDKIIGKPENEEHAYEILSLLNGEWHKVYTGICLTNKALGVESQDVEVSAVKFRTLTDEEIQAYIATGEPMDKAGAYGIQGRGALLVERLKGCYYNIVGLPLYKLQKLLANNGLITYNVFMEVVET